MAITGAVIDAEPGASGGADGGADGCADGGADGTGGWHKLGGHYLCVRLRRSLCSIARCLSSIARSL